METPNTIFRPAWWGPGLPGIRPRLGTYGRYDYQDLPTPPGVAFDGTYGWLRREPEQSAILELDRRDVGKCFGDLSRFCANQSINLPQCFVNFFEELSLARRIRSCTACFLDLATDVIAAPKGDGSIVRFLSDQQGCLFWYLFLAARSDEHFVLASPDYFGSDAVEADFGPGNPESLVFCAPNFESFLFRFWIENEYWFASHGFGAPSPQAAEYLRSLGWSPPDSAPQKVRQGWFRRLLGG